MPLCAARGAGCADGELLEAEIRKNWCYYLANITFIDEQVGRLLAALDASNLAENTIVIFTSDHGDHMGDHGLYGKSTFWDESIRVPLVVAPAGTSEGTNSQEPASQGGPASAGHEYAGGGRVDELVTLMDLFPTVPNLAGARNRTGSVSTVRLRRARRRRETALHGAL